MNFNWVAWLADWLASMVNGDVCTVLYRTEQNSTVL